MASNVRIATYVIAGLAAQFLWAYVEQVLPALVPQTSSTLASQVWLAFTGLVLALALVGPLVLVAAPRWPHCGIALVAGYILGGIPGRDPDGELALLLQTPGIWGWAFLVSSLILIWLRGRVHAPPTIA